MSLNLAELAAPFESALRERRLVLPRCDSCGKHFFYATVLCPHCHSDKHSWVPASGQATLYSYTEVYSAPAPELEVPYTVGVVDLREQVRMMTNIVGVPSAELRVGMPLRAGFSENWEGRPIVVFGPAES